MVWQAVHLASKASLPFAASGSLDFPASAAWAVISSTVTTSTQKARMNSSAISRLFLRMLSMVLVAPVEELENLAYLGGGQSLIGHRCLVLGEHLLRGRVGLQHGVGLEQPPAKPCV